MAGPLTRDRSLAEAPALDRRARLRRAPEPVFRRENGGEAKIGHRHHQVGEVVGADAARLIGDEPDPLASEPREAVRDERRGSRLHALSGGRRRGGITGARDGKATHRGKTAQHGPTVQDMWQRHGHL